MLELESFKGTLFSFGEALWDFFPKKKQPGGSPLNVAYHLSQQGHCCQLVSRIARDRNGLELIEFIRQSGIGDHHIQLDMQYPTGMVKVVLDKGIPSYDIIFPSAWDFIASTNQLQEHIDPTGLIIYGSLATRNEVSYRTLIRLLKLVGFRILDLNLRAPYIEKGRLDNLLHFANLLKINEEELFFLTDHLDALATIEHRIEAVAHRYEIPEIICTLGPEGAHYWSSNVSCFHPVFKVEILDTVGCGDAFLAGFLSARMHGHSVQEALRSASARAACVATLPGATPVISHAFLDSLLESGPV